MLLGTYLHERRFCTHVAHEVKPILLSRVPPGTSSAERYIVSLFWWFVRDQVLPHWRIEEDEGSVGLAGTDADNRLLEIALQRGLPLITNEQVTTEGIDESRKGLRSKAKGAGVAVFAPGEFLSERGVRLERLERMFLERWQSAAPRYQREHRRREGPDDVVDLMERVFIATQWLFRPDDFEMPTAPPD